MTTPLGTEPDLVENLVEADLEVLDTRRLSRRRLIVRRFFRNKLAVTGLIVYLLLALLAIFGPYISQWGPNEIDRGVFLQPPEGEWRFWQWPSGDHWFGTTQSGHDLFARTIEGLRVSMVIGLAVALISTTVAAVVGSFAAYFGGLFERLSLWTIDLLLIIPSFLLIAIVMSREGAGVPILRDLSGQMLLIVFLSGLTWMLSARVVRSMTMTLRERDYVVAARYMGVPGPTIVFRHILPNMSSLLIIDATLLVALAVLHETFLSFFGLGIQDGVSLGTLIGNAQRGATVFPWTFWFPAGFLVVMVVAINFIGDGLRDALDPSSRSAGKA